MELAMANGFGGAGFTELDEQEMMWVDGGSWLGSMLTGISAAATILGTACTGIAAYAGSSVFSMGVAALAGCGPVGWTILGVATIAAAASGAAIALGARGEWA